MLAFFLSDHLPFAARRGVSHAPFSGTEPLLAAVGPLSAAPVAADGPAGCDPVRHHLCAGGHTAGGEPLHRPGHLRRGTLRSGSPCAAHHWPRPSRATRQPLPAHPPRLPPRARPRPRPGGPHDTANPTPR